MFANRLFFAITKQRGKHPITRKIPASQQGLKNLKS